MRRTLPAGLLLSAACAFGQGTPATPAFEVASVKPAGPITSSGARQHSSNDPGRVTHNSVTLRILLMNAYKVRDYQIFGPSWMADEHYDVAAKIPENTAKDQVPPMLQALLAERFHLVLHHELKEMSAYALTVAKGGFKLQSVDGPAGFSMRFSGSQRSVQGKTTLGGLAGLLSSFVGDPVLDTTGLAGTFDFKLEWSPDDREQGLMGLNFTARGDSGPGKLPDTPVAPPPGPSLFAAIQTLGVKLEPRKAPIDTLVIDRAEKIPTEN